MTRPDPDALDAVLGEVDAALGARAGRPVVVGLCGAQGSGKSTLAAAATKALEATGRRVAVLSLDDLYLTRAERQALAREVHPLFATRGVPGTHSVALGLDLLDRLARGEPAALPRFDKARDDRAPEADWRRAPAGCEVLLFEGWCVGAGPQDEAALEEPVNALEAAEDPDGTWRRTANAALTAPYAQLVARLDRLILLAAPSFEVVAGWRLQQEQDLARSRGSADGLMDKTAVARFVAHYERITRAILAEMPARADLVVRLDEARRPLTITRR